jgi:uncharacterized protein (DUF1501 family)
MKLSRRAFLKRGGLALVSVGTIPLWGPSFLQQLVFAAEPVRAAGGKKILICIFQRGALDGLSMVVPFGDKRYYESRFEIAIAQPTQKAGPEGVLDLDGFFGFHPNMAALLPLYKSGHLALIQACGSPSSSRSHFDAQDFMECGVADDKSIRTGWLNRALLQCPCQAHGLPRRLHDRDATPHLAGRSGSAGHS